MERDGRRVLALGSGGGEGGVDEPVPAAGLVEVLLVPRQQRAGRLQRGGPGVAHVQHVRALAGGGGDEDAVEQVGPGNDLPLDLDAGRFSNVPSPGWSTFLSALRPAPWPEAQ